MKTRKIPLRQCIGCGEAKNKKDLLRIIKTPEDEVVLDVTGKKNGRGSYICNSRECLLKAKKTKALERSLKTEVPKNVYDAIESEMEELNAK